MSEQSPVHRAVTFEARVEVAEAWADALLAAGASSVDAADAHAGTPLEKPVYGEPATHPWPVVRLTVLFEQDAPWERMLERAARAAGEPAPACSSVVIPDADWVRATQAQFQPIRVTERLWIVPSWRSLPDPAAVAIRLDPGLAFGT
ncbi:MAG TPA: 50S ribosomal protein L11 methyltransferase, partial [Burkholderiales bacterium]